MVTHPSPLGERVPIGRVRGRVLMYVLITSIKSSIKSELSNDFLFDVVGEYRDTGTVRTRSIACSISCRWWKS